MTQATSIPTHHAQAPETLTIGCDVMGGHGQHWAMLSDDPNRDIPLWLQLAVDDAALPQGLHQSDAAMPKQHWLIQGPQRAIHITQIIDIDEHEHPLGLRNAYPSLDSPHFRPVKIHRVLTCPDSQDAVLNLETTDGITIHAFDSLYAINAPLYQKDQVYSACFSAWAYGLEHVGVHEELLVDDPAAIRHHRALNAILAENGGVAPDDLQARLDAWQPANSDDEAPVTLDLSKMAAYLFGETFGQEDEAWFQGEIIGAQTVEFMQRPIDLFDVVILREQHTQPFVIRLAYANRSENKQHFQVGEYIRGNIWMQVAIHVTT